MKPDPDCKVCHGKGRAIVSTIFLPSHGINESKWATCPCTIERLSDRKRAKLALLDEIIAGWRHFMVLRPEYQRKAVGRFDAIEKGGASRAGV